MIQKRQYNNPYYYAICIVPVLVLLILRSLRDSRTEKNCNHYVSLYLDLGQNISSWIDRFFELSLFFHLTNYIFTFFPPFLLLILRPIL